MTGPLFIARRVLEPSAVGGHQVLVHHHEHHMTDVLRLIRESPRQRAVNRSWRATSRAPEDESRTGAARALDAIKQTLGEMLSNRIG
jgi:hypothetical protein